MKNKKMIYLLGVVVAIVWGLIIYRIFEAAAGDEADSDTPVTVNTKKEPFNDFAVQKDTSHLLLNYRDPFGLAVQKDTASAVINRKHFEHIIPGPVVPPVNWSFVQYSGYIRNPKSKRLVTLVNINGKSEMLAEGDSKSDVKLVKNMGDSIKIRFNGKTKFIHLKTVSQ